jgi:acetoacetyl-CoA reductase
MGGLGTAICQALANEGCTVVANCLPGYSEKDAWLLRMKENGYDFLAAEGDVSDYDSCETMVREIEAQFGPITILVNNAGITRDNRFLKMPKSDWGAVLRVNLDSVFNLTQHVLPKMEKTGWGRIINISSVNGIKGQFGQANYAAAKAGILGFTLSLASEYAKKGITVNAIAPGYIATDMVMAIKEEAREKIIAQVPMGRLGKPEEIGALVAYLISEKAGFMTGATLNINGGMHMC